MAGSSQSLSQARTAPVAFTGQPGDNAAKKYGGCEDDCAEEECLDPDQCGAESRPPKPENLVCGLDTRPLLPVGLAVSTVVGMMVVLLLQLPLLSRLYGVDLTGLSCAAVAVYGVTLGCMTYCAFCDPGQLRRGQRDASTPKRAYKSWQYKRAVRRYDHYCRWLSNCIGLLNHREFLTMLVGLGAIGTFGVAADLVLSVSMLRRGFWGVEVLIALHLGYSVALLALAGPILKIHTGLVSRNELASEWKRNDFYVARSAKRGENVPANDLSDDEFNSLFDSFVYDRRRNAFDRGVASNCFGFWCLPRWAPDQQGEF